ncbi:MAG: phosphoadenylyl-sulfate reductase [Cyclobacteriaceae bacterium]|nr:phosphoadenylyl-sulfate reductase [Cyclobacteriaceae bacterium]
MQTKLEGLSAQEGLAWVAAQGLSVAFSTALGEEDQAITHMIATQRLNIRIVTLDTGRLFPETYDLWALTQSKYGLSIQAFFPDRARVEDFVNRHGINAFYDSVDHRKACCQLRKVEPLKRALDGAAVWVTGVRAAQSANRQQMKKVAWDAGMNLIKYNPLLDWSDADLRAYVQQYAIPVNTLHKKGFASIGCAPCTRAIAPGEDPRAGRWWWETSAKECGLHETKTSAAAAR